MNDAFWLYAMECEGKISTRKGRLNRAIKMLANSANPNSIETQTQIFEQVGLSMITYEEAKYIEEGVSRRWRSP